MRNYVARTDKSSYVYTVLLAYVSANTTACYAFSDLLSTKRPSTSGQSTPGTSTQALSCKLYSTPPQSTVYVSTNSVPSYGDCPFGCILTRAV